MLCLGSLGSSKDSLITERDSFALLLLIGRLRLLGERFKGYLELLTTAAFGTFGTAMCSQSRLAPR